MTRTAWIVTRLPNRSPTLTPTQTSTLVLTLTTTFNHRVTRTHTSHLTSTPFLTATHTQRAQSDKVHGEPWSVQGSREVHTYPRTCTPIHVHGHLQTICSLTQKHFYRMNFGAGLVSSSSSNSPCMPPFFPLLCPVWWHFSGISNGDVSSRSTSDFSLCRCSLRD